jgi:uncharacterized protein
MSKRRLTPGPMTATITVREARRLALARGGLLKPLWTGMPHRSPRSERRRRDAAIEVIRRFGYLQLDTVSVAGARSHAIVLMSRIAGFPASLAEQLLVPGEPLFEYWGHEVSWMPIEFYPLFQFRRLRLHPWWGDVLSTHSDLASDIMRRIRDEGPLRSSDLEGKDHGAWWAHRPAKKVIVALWSSGALAIRERRNFQRTYDLTERVIPAKWRAGNLPIEEALQELLLKALDGHGWAQTNTLSATWRLSRHRREMLLALEALVEQRRVLACDLVGDDGRKTRGWIRPDDLQLAARLGRAKIAEDRGVLLSPFDPLLWDRRRVTQLFGFEQVLEIFKPAQDRIYGYYCLPLLAGERLIGRFDVKAERRAGRLRVLSRHWEAGSPRKVLPVHQEAASCAFERYAVSVGLEAVFR